MTTTTTDPAVLSALAALYAAVVGVFRVHHVELPTVPRPPLSRSRLAGKILDALQSASAPMPGKALARAAGHSADAHFRRVVAALKREGKVARVKGGYVLPTTEGGVS